MSKKKNSKSKIVGLLYLIILILILVFLFFNEKGILKYLEVKGRVESLENEIDSSNREVDKIGEEIDSLKSNRFKKEKTAREKYNMKRPHEKGLDIKVKNNGK